MQAARVADQGRPADTWLMTACRLTWRAKLHMHLMLDLFNQAREKAEAEAITVFSNNLKDLLLAAPAGPRIVLGIDPGIRTGCKIAIVDTTGKLIATETIYPHEPRREWDKSLHTLKTLCTQHHVTLIAIGNGTASRETDKLVSDLIKAHPALKLQKSLSANQEPPSILPPNPPLKNSPTWMSPYAAPSQLHAASKIR